LDCDWLQEGKVCIGGLAWCQSQEFRRK